MAALTEKPVLVVAAFGAAGHAAGLIQISAHLIKKGYKVYFITGAGMKPSVEKAGALFVENPWRWESVLPTRPPNFDTTWNIRHLFGDSTPAAYRALKSTLEEARKANPGREVLIIHETLASGLGPFKFGAPLPDGYSTLPRVIGFHSSVYAASEGNTPPFGPGLPYDPTAENLALWRSLSESFKPDMTRLIDHYNHIYASLGATRPMKGLFFNELMASGDVTVLATSPSLEYPPNSLNPNIRFIGGLPLKAIDPGYVYPPWWPTIAANAALPAGSPEKKKVVFVTQGTVHRNFDELILPTVAALASRTDLIVIATLGIRGAELEGATAVPANTIVVDYLAYDVVLPHADVFVSNAGYGGFMHGVMNGVPMVLAGTEADKAEVCARAEYAGIAVNLRSQKPGEDAIKAAVDKVLGDETFKARAVALQRENVELDALTKIERIVEEVAGSV